MFDLRLRGTFLYGSRIQHISSCEGKSEEEKNVLITTKSKLGAHNHAYETHEEYIYAHMRIVVYTFYPNHGPNYKSTQNTRTLSLENSVVCSAGYQRQRNIHIERKNNIAKDESEEKRDYSQQIKIML